MDLIAEQLEQIAFAIKGLATAVFILAGVLFFRK